MSNDTSSIIIKKTRTRTKKPSTLSPEEVEEKKRIKEIKLVARKAKNKIVSREWREKNKERIREYNLSIANNKQKVYLETYRVKNLGNMEWLEKKRARGRKYALKKRIEVKEQLEIDINLYLKH